jgi:predicted nucleic acid-binding protein
MAGVDTSFLIDFLAGDPAAVALYKRQQERLCVSDIVVYEFLCGNITEEQEQRFLALLDQCVLASFERNEAITSARLFRQLRKQGKTRSSGDLAIAGSYLANHVGTILTRNVKDFESIPGLTVVGY